ncbi:Crp/Fnr family transcriptional regulator [Parasporobacterium paucivorans]|uniref:cAMP-binding domain of CRP or a regulatory subunit of cAMP-dependent protein kinases n=1 Tax=Parasporobacterium paucivorans DSM 15970 TaxID=1122934 RepID=A0A1M6GZA3_9FIRM|nr:Crp/Fnr family transcriptional regulator [Parasporobacterium paucivorans]SHJ15257.1 cAMP-binding domain of CRP or a regulatory subunit of cAMP-dependent protein kinases [Parasporobacterium paucivorans DSM 15970]
MDLIISVLADSKIFQGISKETIRKNFSSFSGNIKSYQKGEIFVSEDDFQNFIGIILEGEFCVTKMYLDGSQFLLQKAGPSYAVGVDIVFTRTQISPYSVSATEDSKIFLLPNDVIRTPGKIDEKFRLIILENILTIISHENMRKYNTLELLAKKSLRDKAITYLLRQKKKYNSSTFTIPLNREQLAEYLCVNRSALSHELSLMQKDGLIRYTKNTFTILAP